MLATASPRAGALIQAQTGPDGYATFHPKPLPPDPPLNIGATLQILLERAGQALGHLDGLASLLPDPDLLIYSYVRKEAVLSSQIEGTQSSLADLLLFENENAPSVPSADVQETSNYVTALNHGLNRLGSGELPLSSRLIRKTHRLLLSGVRGSDRAPGEFRRTQNWLGGTRPSDARFVPPPWQEVPQAMSDLERFLHDDPSPSPALIKAALAHAQFETIHPFLDGNGRVGRLLIVLVLFSDGVLQQPLLYISLHLKRHRDTYYDHLQRIRTDGAWEDWLRFFLEGVIDVAGSTVDTTRQIVRTFERDRRRIHALGRGAATAQRLHDLMCRVPMLGVGQAARRLELTPPAVYKAVDRLQELGIVREVTGRRRGKVFAYDEYLTLLTE